MWTLYINVDLYKTWTNSVRKFWNTPWYLLIYVQEDACVRDMDGIYTINACQEIILNKRSQRSSYNIAISIKPGKLAQPCSLTTLSFFWLTNQALILISLKMIMESSKKACGLFHLRNSEGKVLKRRKAYSHTVLLDDSWITYIILADSCCV